MKLTDKKVKDFLSDLAAKTPTPGGGSAAALAGAMAAALVAMVAEFTLGKEKYRSVEKDFQEILNKAKKLQRELTDLIDKDSQAYEEVVKSKNSAEAIKKAAEIPLQTAEKSLLVLQMAKFAHKYGNQKLASDSFGAVYLAKTAIGIALENVKINLPYLAEEKTREKITTSIEKIMKLTEEINC